MAGAARHAPGQGAGGGMMKAILYAMWLLPLAVAVMAAYRVIHRLHYDEALFHAMHLDHHGSEWDGAHGGVGHDHLAGAGHLGSGMHGSALEEGGSISGWSAAAGASSSLQGGAFDLAGGGGASSSGGDDEEEEEGDIGEWPSEPLLAAKEYSGKAPDEAKRRAEAKRAAQARAARSGGDGGASGARGRVPNPFVPSEAKARSSMANIFQQAQANQLRVDELRRRNIAANAAQQALVRSTIDRVSSRPRGGSRSPSLSSLLSGPRGDAPSRRSSPKKEKKGHGHDHSRAHEKDKSHDKDGGEGEGGGAPSGVGGWAYEHGPDEHIANVGEGEGEGDEGEEGEDEERARATPSPRVAGGGGGGRAGGKHAAAAAAGGSCPLAPAVWNPLASAGWRRRRLHQSAAPTSKGPRGRAAGAGEVGATGGGRRLAAFTEAARGHSQHGTSCDKGAPLKARQGCYEKRMLQRCKSEEAKKDIQPGEEDLAACIKDLASCQVPRADLREAARGLLGIQMLLGEPPACVVYNSARECENIHANDETALTMGCGERGGGPRGGCDKRVMTSWHSDYIRMPRRDFRPKMHRTCAVVGNSMNLFATANGESIDAHDMVLRFNNEVARMSHVLTLDPEEGPLAEHPISHYLGNKTSLRLLNRKYTQEMLERKPASEPVDLKDKSKVFFPPDERLMFWNYFSLPYIKALQSKYTSNQILVMAPEMVNWQLEAFSQLRRDLYRLGLGGGKGGFGCYRSMSSGVHGLFMAFQLCESVDLYGFSVSMDNFKKGFNHGRPSESHSWEFETMLMRLVYFAGLMDVCNA